VVQPFFTNESLETESWPSSVRGLQLAFISNYLKGLQLKITITDKSTSNPITNQEAKTSAVITMWNKVRADRCKTSTADT
jgi:hypothetical protein